jgi:hypothetical protein
MAHFYGTLDGSRGQATRMGTKNSGLQTVAASWQGAVEVTLHHDDHTQRDYATISLKPWHGAGVHRVLFDNLPVDGAP